ncbi:response regulator transcription factor [Amycolatopsis sp. H20-H5]|uniref:response regulator transcription factor n=1 Tax=Amycolatopsis sp. H20-H5 TaxID=3046309 RepID=UPI002DBE9B22|nr:response regulator transcription factor [Amycolatopsis sp. H20-H5]MEC3973739.1 response regulator transcription factor [Amycolatopsis sp. H20-H5]
MPIRVLIADDQEFVRIGLRALLTEPDIEVVAEAGAGDEAVRLARRHLPDVVLADAGIGIEVTARIVAERGARTRVLILTNSERDEDAFRALRAGASGLLCKDIDPRELVDAVRAVARGDAMLAPGVTRRLIAELADTVTVRTPGLPVGLLTAREREVLDLVVAGLSNDEIAARLVIGIATVKTHVGHILSKMDARDRVKLISLAYESGHVRPAVRTPRKYRNEDQPIGGHR